VSAYFITGDDSVAQRHGQRRGGSDDAQRPCWRRRHGVRCLDRRRERWGV